MHTGHFNFNFNFNLELSFLKLLLLTILLGFVSAERIKDIVDIEGVRENYLIGYGLVVGLSGTGDGGETTTKEAFKSMLTQLGVPGAEANHSPKNVAAVMVSANLPAFAKPGQKFDVTVSSIGGAKSLRGGTLLVSALKGVDGKVYALAQGSVIVGGFGAEGLDGSKTIINMRETGRIANGATVERGVKNPYENKSILNLLLKSPDFTTAKRIADVINLNVGANTANPIDPSSVQLQMPEQKAAKVNFMSFVENLVVQPAELAAKVIVNSRTGTIVIGKNVIIGPAAVSHANLTITINENQQANQAAPLTPGETVVTENTAIYINEGDNRMFLFEPGVTLATLVDAINQVGAAPGDVMAILEALSQAGALQADLEVI